MLNRSGAMAAAFRVLALTGMLTAWANGALAHEGHPHTEDDSAGASSAAYLTLPYLQNVKTDGITIMFELDAQPSATVEYGTTAEYGKIEMTKAIDSGFSSRIYKCVLTGLRAGTTYHYRVVQDGTDFTGDRTFTTAPDTPVPFSFGVWSDSQGNNHGAYPGDVLEPTKTMMAHMATSGVSFGVTCGDLAEDGSAYQDTRDFYLDRVAKYLGQKVPWFVAWGNHDKDRSSVIRKFADMPSKDREGFDPGWGSFSFDYAGCHFICIDDNTKDADIADWVESDLKSAANQAAKFTFLFIHVPPYCELWIDGDAGLRGNLVPLVQQYGVDVVFSGHTHEYERGYKEHVHYIIPVARVGWTWRSRSSRTGSTCSSVALRTFRASSMVW